MVADSLSFYEHEPWLDDVAVGASFAGVPTAAMAMRQGVKAWIAHEAGPGAVNAGVFNLMRQISLLYGPRGVTTHTLSPGPADTPRLRRIVAAVAAERGAAEEDVWQEYVAQNSLGRLPTASELAWAVELLLDPEADLLHGSVLYLDAGGHRGIH